MQTPGSGVRRYELLLPKALLAISVAGSCLLPRASSAQTPDQGHQTTVQKFEVATVKESETDESGGIAIRGSQFLSKGTTVADLLAYAYGLQQQQIIGGPDWINKQRYDIRAVPANGSADASQIHAMLATLLAERFSLAFDRGERKMPVFSLSRLNGPLKFKASVGAPSAGAGIGFNGPGSIAVRNATLTEFASLIQRYIADRPIINDTGLDGKYDIELVWNPDPLSHDGAVPPAESDRPDLYAAFRQELGLKLSKVDALAPVLIVKRLERPSAN